MTRTLARVFACCTAALFASCALAAGPGGYPNKPVKIIVPFAPGGPTDTMARLVAQKFSETLGQQFYVDNEPGAGGNIGMGNAAKSAPDGYTLLFVSSSFVVNPSLYAKIPYDANKDFLPVSNVGDAPNILVVHPDVPAKSVSELVALIKANPGKYSFASAGTGTTPHLSGEMFKAANKLDIVHVPFPGAGPAVQSTLAGHTPIGFTSMPPSVPFVQDGKLRALAVSATKRSAALPDVPTMAEAGLSGQEANTFQGLLVPAGTPKEIVDLLYSEIKSVLAMKDVKDKFAALGFDAIGNSPQEFAAQIKTEIAKWDKVIKDAKLKVE
jgi:tripartite-type tricarboxylate transporter receptor subunit TctC